MQNLLIPLGIIVLMSVLGYLTQMLKRAAEKRQMERDRDRAHERARREPVRAEPLRTGSSDIDRFLRAVDAQRQKGGPAPRPAPAKKADFPTATPVRRPRLADTAAFPEAKKKAPPAKRSTPLDDLPVAAVVGGLAAPPVVTAPAQLVKPERASVAPAGTDAVPVTPFGRQFAGLLNGPNALALAVALQEVLGPPKCKRG
jgi:hypothetical protein